MRAYLALLRRDAEQLSRSWLVRAWIVLLAAPAGFLVVVAAREGELASETLAAYLAAVLAPLSWIAVSILSASAINGEAGSVADAVLSRSVTRGEYVWSKITARLGVCLGVYFAVAAPFVYLVRRFAAADDTTTLGVVGGVTMVAALLAFLASYGIGLSAILRSPQIAIMGALITAVASGVLLQFLGLRWMSTTAVLDGLPETFRGETGVADQLRVLIVFVALSAAALAASVWHFRRRDL